MTPDVLYKEIIEVDCRVVPAMNGQCQMKHNWPRVTGKTGEDLFIMKTLDKEALREDFIKLKAKGIKSIAVVLMHSYTYVIFITVFSFFIL